MKKRYPTENGIAISPLELDLPSSSYPDKRKFQSNHHIHFSEYRFAKYAITFALRDLERHQIILPNDVHDRLHLEYEDPVLPTGEQAAIEIIDAYEKGERFKRKDSFARMHVYEAVPRELADHLIATYGLYKINSFAAD